MIKSNTICLSSSQKSKEGVPLAFLGRDGLVGLGDIGGLVNLGDLEVLVDLGDLGIGVVFG